MSIVREYEPEGFNSLKWLLVHGYTVAEEDKPSISEKIGKASMEMLNKRHTNLLAPSQLSPLVMDRHAMTVVGLEDAFSSYNKCEEYIQRVAESYWNCFDYFIDGKKVSLREFLKYANHIKTVKKGEGDNAEYWSFPTR